MTDAKRVGDAWGRLAGLVVDACKSHHESHGVVAGKTDDPEHGERTGSDRDELDGFILTTTQRCKPSWTKNKGEVELLIEVPPGQLNLQPAMMRLLPADGAMSNAVYDGPPVPNQFNGPGKDRVRISISSTLPRGLYVGRIAPATGSQPNTPVLIYIDDVQP